MEQLRKHSLEVWFLLLIVVGYTVFSSVAEPLSIENIRFFTIGYRIIIFFMSLVVIFRNFSLRRFLNISVISTLLFWIFYFAKSCYSFAYDDYDDAFASQFSEIYIRIFTIALVPSIALLSINYKNNDLQFIARQFLFILCLLLSLNFIYALVMPYRLSLRYIFSMYYISYGHLGTSLALIATYFLLFAKEKINTVLLWYSLVLGLSTIFIAGARNPLLAVIVGLFYLFIVKKNYKILFTFGCAVVLSIIGIFFIGRLQIPSQILINRTYLAIFDGNSSLREPLFLKSIDYIKQNFIIGTRTHFNDGIYPHNIFLELMMATGLIGFVLYFAKFIPMLKNLKYLFTNRAVSIQVLFFVLFLQYFVLVLTSFTLYSVPEFLYFSSIIIGISLFSINEENESDDGSGNPSGNN